MESTRRPEIPKSQSLNSPSLFMRMLEGLTSGGKEERRRKRGGGRGRKRGGGRGRKRGGRRGGEGGRGRREAMVCEDLFFVMNYLRTIQWNLSTTDTVGD